MPSFAWAKNHSINFLVIGKQLGDIGEYRKGLKTRKKYYKKVSEMHLLLVSIVVCFSLYILITYHDVFRIGKESVRNVRIIDHHSNSFQFRNLHRSKTYKLQLRFMVSMSIQVKNRKFKIN